MQPFDANRVVDARKRELDHEAEAAQESGVERAAAVRGEDREPRVVLHLLEQVVDLDVRAAVVAVADLGARPEQSVRLVKEEDRAAPLAASKTRRRFFSVSPMYLLTTPARSIRQRSRSRCAARISAAIVSASCAPPPPCPGGGA
jgi:hypothetical protein